MADQPCTNTLDHTKFHVAVRLIQLFQNGKKPVDLALNVSSMGGSGGSGGSGIMKPPYFEGVEVPQPQQQQQQQQGLQQQSLYPSSPQIQPAPSSPQRSPVVPQPTIGMVMPPPLPLPIAATMNTNTMTTTTTTLAIQDPYTMTPQELSRYDALFPMYATKEDTAADDGKMYVSGATAVELFCKSGKLFVVICCLGELGVGGWEDVVSQTPPTPTTNILQRLFLPSLFLSLSLNSILLSFFSTIHKPAIFFILLILLLHNTNTNVGMDRESLKGIWTMVDDPVDNKLDSLEFAVAMHLIVCVTKKGLPIPLSLPGSLSTLVRYARSQQHQQPSQPQQHHHQQQQGSALGSGGGVGGGQSVIGVSGGSMTPQRTPPRGGAVGGGGGGIPTPDNLPSMGGGLAGMQPQMMNGGMSYASSQQPPQYQQQQPPQMMQPQSQQGVQQYQQWGGMQQQQPPPQGVLQSGSFGMQQQHQQQQGIPQTGSFGGGGGMGAATSVGKLSINDAFDGLSNDPVADVDEYSTVGSEVGRDVAVGGGGGDMAVATAVATQSVATWEVSSQPPPALPSLQQHQMHFQGQPQFQQQQQQQQLPPRSPRGGPPKSPRSSRNLTASSSEDSAAELLSLREAHQKLQAEVISLRAKAASVTDEEVQMQNEIKSIASEIGKLSLELSTLKESVMEAKVKLNESVGVLKIQMGKKE